MYGSTCIFFGTPNKLSMVLVKISLAFSRKKKRSLAWAFSGVSLPHPHVWNALPRRHVWPSLPVFWSLRPHLHRVSSGFDYHWKKPNRHALSRNSRSHIWLHMLNPCVLFFGTPNK